MSSPTTPLDRLRARAFTVPTDAPESDGTLAWDSTTLVTVEVAGGGRKGLGWTYAAPAAAHLVNATLADVVCAEADATPERVRTALLAAVRNLGRQGLVACALSAIDVALWDLRARLHGLSVVDELGRARDEVPVYGSGGFCTQGPGEVAEQLGGWAEAGMQWVKMKVGRHPDEDPARLEAARGAVGDDVGLMVDANGAFTYGRARAAADLYGTYDACWLEEPVTSDDPASLRRLREVVPAGMEITAGEYAWDTWALQGLLEARAVDVPQVDVTRAGGFSGVARSAVLCDAHHLDLSTHCAPHLSALAACATPLVRHVEWFHDHVRIEKLLFDGAVAPVAGLVRPDADRPGLGVTLREADAEPYEVRC